MIEIKNVSKEFVKKIEGNKEISFLADDDVSFTAKEGEVVGLLGPNGAGKTTLLRVIAGIMDASSGSVTINGVDSKGMKKDIAFLSGNTKLYKDLSAYELLKMFGEYYGMSKSKIEERIKVVSERFKLDSFLHQRIENLSTGQTQRVGVARCVIHDPKYYILDEATSGLDVISSKIIIDFINEEKKKGKCFIYSTHYMEEAENICDNVVLIHKGKVIKEGVPKSILKDTKTTNLRDAFFALIEGDSYE